MFLSLLSSRILPGILLLSFLSRVHSQSDPGASFSVDTPSSVGQCDTTKFTWKGGQAPFTLDVVFQENSSVFQDFNRLSGSPLAWEATVPAGTVLVLSLYSPDDIGGDYVRLSNPFTIQAGNDSCLGSTTPRSKTNIVATSSSHTTTSQRSSSFQRSTARYASPKPTQPSTPSQTSPIATSTLSTPTSPPSDGQSRLSTGAIAGIAVGVGIVAICLALASCWYIQRRRRRGAPMALSDPFIAVIGPSRRGPGVSATHAGMSSSGVDRKRRRRKREMSAVQTQSNSSLVAQASSMRADVRDFPVARPSYPGHRENINGVAMVAAKLPFSHGIGGEQHWVPQQESDGGVRLAGGRVAEVLVTADDSQDHSLTLVDSILPPPYSAHFSG